LKQQNRKQHKNCLRFFLYYKFTYNKAQKSRKGI